MKIFLLIMKSIAYYILPALLFSSCGGDKASSDIQGSVRSKLPLYYEINDLKAETSKQNFLGKEVNVSQLAVDVTLNEDLYISSTLSDELQRQLNQNKTNTFGFSGRYSSDKEFIKKVATKGETKTLYGELVTTDLADGKSDIKSFKIKDAKGKPMSAFNKSEVVIVDSPEESAYVKSILAKRAEVAKAREEQEAKMADEKRLKKEAEKARLDSIVAEEARTLNEKKKMLSEIFAKGKTYEGAYILRSGEDVAVTVTKFDAQFLHGTLEVKKKESKFKTDIKFAFRLEQSRRGEGKSYKISGANDITGELDKGLIRSSSLASNARYNRLKISEYSVSDDSVMIGFGSSGKLILKR